MPDRIRVLIVGPADTATGGVARYFAEQRSRMPSSVSSSTYSFGPASHDGGLSFLVAILRTAVAFACFPLRSRPDVVHVHTSHRFSFYRAALYVLFVAHVWRRPVVVHVHGSSFDEFVTTGSYAVWWLQARVFAAAETVVVLSPHWKRTLSLTCPAAKIRVLPNAVDVTEYSPACEVEPPHVVFVSNLIERKGVSEFLAALEALEAPGAECLDGGQVSIAGKGPLADRVTRFVESRPDVEYLGYVSEAEKRELLESASIYVLPTHAEGLPIALLEGMAACTAVVTTPVGSIPEVVDDENGILVPPGDSDRLASALRTMLEEPARAESMARNNRQLVRETYSWSSVIPRLTAIYREAVDGRTDRSGSGPDDSDS